MKRRFNTSGPCIEGIHYMIPADRRTPEAPGLVEQMGHFVVHAPRQTGKTTAMRALASALTSSGKYAAVHFSCEAARAWEDDIAAAERVVLGDMCTQAQEALPPELHPPPPSTSPGSAIRQTLAAWADTCRRPLVLIFDEIDALSGRSLLSVLSQLRAGFPNRPAHFPWSVILCGLRDVRDYKAASGGDPSRLGTSSPFNIKLEALRVGDFTPEEVRELYGQHTADTGQVFTEDALERAFEVTAGQPWLVNALAREIVEKMAVPLGEAIAHSHVEQAKERLILARATHLDSLVARLREPRVRRVIEPVIAGDVLVGDVYDDDASYVRDLGLVAPGKPLRIANPIYREVIVRVLAVAAEDSVTAEPRSFVLPDGRLDFARILRELADFWREHGDVLSGGMPYHEVAPQLIVMAFLQRVVNGGGYIDREYGVARGRINLLVRWPYPGADGRPALQREAMELKVWRDKGRSPLIQGLAQLDQYLTTLDLDTGVLVIFDRRSAAEDIAARTRFDEAVTPSGRRVTVLWA